MLTPDQFEVNEAWITLRVNEEFIFVKDDPYDIFVLMDAASAYVFGFVLSSVVDESLDQEEVANLFRQAWGTKQEWAGTLIVSDEINAGNVFISEGEKNGLEIRRVSASSLNSIVGPLRESFLQRFLGQ
ncbi:MAG: hypothetical protein B6I30_09975 [Desulfobacteraceae bacterium 4572_187]|nr:MAG: hypothetical protein B6I30_09975 [Desulfobacteraceae bacterium 4572_187]